MRGNELKQKILMSGIFRLNDKSYPIGIINFTPNKTLSKRDNNYLPYKSHVLRSLISDLSYEIDKYCQSPKGRDLLGSLKDDFEKEFISFLKDWGFSQDTLNPHYTAIVRKAKRKLDKDLSGHAKNIERLDTKDTARRDTMIYQMHRAFTDYTKIKTTDINRYIAHILIACDLESDSAQIVFSKIDRAYHRYPKSS